MEHFLQEVICPKLQELLFFMHAFLTAKVASVDPAFMARGSAGTRYATSWGFGLKNEKKWNFVSEKEEKMLKMKWVFSGKKKKKCWRWSDFFWEKEENKILVNMPTNVEVLKCANSGQRRKSFLLRHLSLENFVWISLVFTKTTCYETFRIEFTL